MIRVVDYFVPLMVMACLFAPFAHAEAPININIDMSGVIGAVNSNTQTNQQDLNETKTTLNNTLTGLPFDFFGLFTGAIRNSMIAFNQTLLEAAKILIETNPDPDSMFGLWQAITIVISSFYLLIFLIIGVSFLIAGPNVEKRERAKEWLKKALMMIIGVNISFVIYKLGLELATAITQFMWVTGFEQFFDQTVYATLGIPMLFAFAGAAGLALITLFARYLFLLAGVVLFPIGIFLYLTPKLESWGKLIFNFIGVILAMQFIDVIILVATNQVGLQLAGQISAGIVPALGFFLVAIANSLILVYAVSSSVSSIVNNTPGLGFVVGLLTRQVSSLAANAKGGG